MLPRAQFTIGDFYYNTRSYGEALRAYRHLIARYPESDEAARAESLVDELNEIEASLEYAEVMKLFEAKKYEEALAGFEQIIQKYPGTYTELAAHCNMGLSYEIMRRWKKAAESYETGRQEWRRFSGECRCSRICEAAPGLDRGEQTVKSRVTT